MINFFTIRISIFTRATSLNKNFKLLISLGCALHQTINKNFQIKFENSKKNIKLCRTSNF